MHSNSNFSLKKSYFILFIDVVFSWYEVRCWDLYGLYSVKCLISILICRNCYKRIYFIGHIYLASIHIFIITYPPLRVARVLKPISAILGRRRSTPQTSRQFITAGPTQRDKSTFTPIRTVWTVKPENLVPPHGKVPSLNRTHHLLAVRQQCLTSAPQCRPSLLQVKRKFYSLPFQF